MSEIHGTKRTKDFCSDDCKEGKCGGHPHVMGCFGRTNGEPRDFVCICTETTIKKVKHGR